MLGGRSVAGAASPAHGDRRVRRTVPAARHGPVRRHRGAAARRAARAGHDRARRAGARRAGAAPAPGTGGSTTRWTRGRSPTPWPGCRGSWGPSSGWSGALEQLQVPLAQAREALGIPGMDAATARNVRDKSRMKEVLTAAGVPCARHQLVRARRRGARVRVGGRVPAGREAARGRGRAGHLPPRRRRRPAQLAAAIPPRPEAPGLLEEFLVGDEHTFDSVQIGGATVWASISDYRPPPLDGAAQPVDPVDGAAPPRARRPALPGDLRRRARPRCGRSACATALTHMEWFRRPDGSVAVSEVGARPPGAQLATMLGYVHDVDFFRHVVRAGDPRPVRRRRRGSTPRAARTCAGRAAAGCARCTASTSCSDGSGTSSSRRSCPSRGSPRRPSYEGEGYVIVRDPDTAVVARRARRDRERHPGRAGGMVVSE